MKHRRCTFFQALCQGPEGRSLNSFGRRRRRRRETFRQGRELNEDISLREMFRVYETREEIPAKLSVNKIGGTSSPKVGPQVCLNSTEYYGLVTTFLVNIFSYPLSQNSSMLDLKNSFSDHKVLLYSSFLKTSQQSKKGLSECATPKENTNRITASVDEEHFLVFC